MYQSNAISRHLPEPSSFATYYSCVVPSRRTQKPAASASASASAARLPRPRAPTPRPPNPRKLPSTTAYPSVALLLDHTPPRRPSRHDHAMYIRSEPDLSPGDQLCPPSYPPCEPALSAGPALPDLNAENSSASTSPTLEPAPQNALAENIQRIGKQNFVGIVVIAVLVFVGLVLWLSFGQWPRKGMRRFRERLKRGDSRLARSGRGHGGGGGDCGQDVRSGARSAARPANGQHDAHAQDEKREVGGRRTGSPSSPLSMEIEVDSLEKEAGETQTKRIPRVHFADPPRA
ncbi:hypothetical protein BV20DRAFT_491658 [Pilatotrama ljubarskyi]|nr:hypothetical protein BV20DRAFT_491658 [Pilatotrama ljubarskyi]